MEGLFLTIALSIVIPLLILLIWFFLIFIVVKRCVFRKRQPSANGDNVPSRLEHCENTSISTCRVDEPISSNQDCPSDVCEQERDSLSLMDRWTRSNHQNVLQLPLYSTLPRNSTRPFSRDCSHDPRVRASRHGYRLYPDSYSPFSQDARLGQSETMQALSMYCDRFITDACYDPPPPYNSRENVPESSTSRILHSSSSGCETWI